MMELNLCDRAAQSNEAQYASCERGLLLPLAPSLFRSLPPLPQWIHLVPYRPPIANSVTVTGSLKHSVCFLRLPQHPVPGRTGLSSRATTPSQCPMPSDIPTRLLNSSINKVPVYTLARSHRLSEVEKKDTVRDVTSIRR
jgi:hypothetical protein